MANCFVLCDVDPQATENDVSDILINQFDIIPDFESLMTIEGAGLALKKIMFSIPDNQ